jgi:hypothetical protein
MELQEYPKLDVQRCRFQLYASGEYSRMLESQWEQQE